MIENPTQEQITFIKEVFQEWLTIQDRKKELSLLEKDLKDKVKKTCECTSSQASAVLKTLRTLWEDGTNEVNDVACLIELIQANGGDLDE